MRPETLTLLYDLLYSSVKGKKINAFDYLEILAKVYWDQGDLRYVQNPTGTWNFYENFIKKFNSVTELRNSNSFFKDFEGYPIWIFVVKCFIYTVWY